MQLKRASKAGQRSVLACFADGPAFDALPAPIRQELGERLLRDPVAAVPTLGHLPQARVVAAQAPPWQDLAAVRRRGGALLRALPDWNGAVDLQLPPGLPEDGARALVLGCHQAAYRWDRYQSEAPPRPSRLRLIGLDERISLPRLQALADATALSRDLTNTPAEDLGPAEFVSAARRAARGTGLRITVFDAAECRRRKLNCLLTVGRASTRPPRLLRISWPGRKADKRKTLALCGKGICFDTGGLNIKVGDGMLLMRKDMGGAATVLGAMLAIAAAGARRPVTAYIALADNAIAGNAFRPGDVLHAADGTSIEIGNTDAEGRLVLADAVALARREGAAEIVSVATLTGAALIALGRVRVPLMGNDENLLGNCESAAASAGEKVWRLPFDDEYRAMLAGSVAQLNNSPGREASCITAGAFIAHFAGPLPFAHCDISPAIWQPSAHELGPPGATGILVATLARLAG